MTELMSPIDRLKMRLVFRKIDHIEEHLEAMQRDPHGLEYAPWKTEVDNIWKEIFSDINDMSEDCLLYTSDAAAEGLGVDLGGRRIMKK